MKNLILTEDYSSIGKCEEIRVSYENSTDLVWIDKPSKYEFVDLGLPSGTLWATCNVGANSPEEFGLYFAWGETKGYTAEEFQNGDRIFNLGSYKFTNDNDSTFIKYNTIDNKTTLDLEDDAAYQDDKSCRMPTSDEITELLNNTTYYEEEINNIRCIKFTSSNGNYIFIPAAGLCNDIYYEWSNGTWDYWSSSRVLEKESSAYFLNCVAINQYQGPICGYFNRYFGFPIRPVKYK